MQLSDLLELRSLEKDQLVQLCEALYHLLLSGNNTVVYTQASVPPMLPANPNPYVSPIAPYPGPNSIPYVPPIPYGGVTCRGMVNSQQTEQNS